MPDQSKRGRSSSTGENRPDENTRPVVSQNKKPPFRVQLTRRFLVVGFVALSLLSFGLGRVCRSVVLGGLLEVQMKMNGPPPREQRQQTNRDADLPHPVLANGKRIPKTIYTSKQFSTALPTTSDTILLSRRTQSNPDHFEVSADGEAVPFLVNEDEWEEEEHEPRGQHLIIDIENVDGAFLNSEERLAKAMLELVEVSGLTLLSYHCHSLEPMGVSCVGILLESHVSFHTWPVQGVILLDVFTCGSQPLAPLLSYVEKIFGLARESVEGEDVEPTRTQWAFKNRGFDRREDSSNPESSEFNMFFTGWMGYDLRAEVVSVQTSFQQIDILDIIDARFRTLESHQKSISGDGSYESKHPQIFRPDRVVFLDEVMQSRRYGDAAYHEPLVHPAMFAHKMPRRVAIIGGGEGGTLREVLKHNALEKVVMVEIDEIMVNVSREYLPEWSDCSDIVGRTPSCFDDPLAEIYYEDAIAWFIDRFATGVEFDDADRFDVIIMDALDPSSFNDFSDILYDNDALMGALANALTDQGILVSQVGESDKADGIPSEYTRESVLHTSFIPKLEEHGFEKVHGYEEMHGGFMAVWKYLVAFKDKLANVNWYANQAYIDYQIRMRILPTVSGESSLRYFDGSLMQTLAFPSRISENLFCLKDEKPAFCDRGHGFDPEKLNVPIDSFEVKESSVVGAGRGVYTKVAIPKGNYIAIDEEGHDMLIQPRTRWLLKEIEGGTGYGHKWKIFDSYVFGYGFASDYYGGASFSVDPNILTFMNHGCRGTNNIGAVTAVTEMTADPHLMPEELYDDPFETAVYNPYIDRNHMLLFRTVTAIKDIKAGEEILDNYLDYLHDENWEWGILNYRAMCSQEGAGAGIVTAYEHEDAGNIVF